MSSYCDLSDVFCWIPAETALARRRLVASVDTATNLLTLDGHGMATDDPVLFRAEAGGSLPSPLVAGTTYYAIRVTSSTLRVSDAAGGSALDLTTAGENVVAIVEPPWEKWIEAASNELECTLPAHVVPLVAPLPPIVVSYVAGLVAEKAMGWAGTSMPGFDARMGGVRKDLDRWRSKGANIRGAVVPPASNLAITASQITIDSRGWATNGQTVIP